MADTLPELLDNRSHLLQELSHLGDFQPGFYTFDPSTLWEAFGSSANGKRRVAWI